MTTSRRSLLRAGRVRAGKKDSAKPGQEDRWERQRLRLRVRRDLLMYTRGDRTTTEEDKIRAWAEEYAKENGWVLNPDKDVLDTG